MNIPGFTAENSLGKKAGYNTVPSRMVGLLAQPKKGIYPAEIINVQSCGPNQFDIRDSEGNLIGCVAGGVGAGGDGGSGTADPTDVRGGGGKGGQQKPPPPKKPPPPPGFRNCTSAELTSSEDKLIACMARKGNWVYCTESGLLVCCRVTVDRPGVQVVNCPSPQPTQASTVGGGGFAISD